MAIRTDRFPTRCQTPHYHPSNQALLSDEDILQLGDDCIQQYMLPILLGAQQNYYVYPTQVQLVPGQEEYPVPYRAVGRGLRELKLSYDGTSTGVRDLTQIELEDVSRFAQEGTPVGYYFRGDKIILTPVPQDSTQILLYWYEIPPNKMVLPTQAASVVGISPGVTTTDITVDIVPDTIVVNGLVDFIEAKSGNTLLGIDRVVTNIAGSTLTFNNSDIPVAPNNLSMGDFICLSGYAPVVQVPNEALMLLETLTARKVLEAIGDFDGAGVLQSRERELTEYFRKLIEPRNQGALKKIVPPRSGLLRGRGFGIFNNRFFY